MYVYYISIHWLSIVSWSHFHVQTWWVLFVRYIHKLLLLIILLLSYVFYSHNSFCILVFCLLLSNDKFCISFGGSIEYWINNANECLCHYQSLCAFADKVILYTISTVWFCTCPCFTMLNYITFTLISHSLHCYHYYQNLWIEWVFVTDLSVVVPSCYSASWLCSPFFLLYY